LKGQWLKHVEKENGPDGLHFQPEDIFTIPETAQHLHSKCVYPLFLAQKLVLKSIPQAILLFRILEFASQLTLPFCRNGNENTWQSKLYNDTSKQERLINWNVFSESMC